MLSQITLSDAKDIATIVGVIVAVVALLFTAINTRLTLRTTRARFWLDLRDRFAKHDQVHLQLRPGGAWSSGAGPRTAEEFAPVEAYMGLFEHCKVMLDEHLIDENTFKAIYRYRLKNIVANSRIRNEKLIQLAPGWRLFIGLLKNMEIEISKECSDAAQSGGPTINSA